MKKELLAGVVTVLLVVGMVGLAHAVLLDFKYSGSDISGSGVLEITKNNTGFYSATNGSTSLVYMGNDYGNFTLIANPNASDYATSPLGVFYYDNLFSFSSTQPPLDYLGLLFSNGTSELNIYKNFSAPLYTASIGIGAFPHYTNDSNLTFTTNTPESAPAPEPGTMLLLGTGIAGMVRMGCIRTLWPPSRKGRPHQPSSVENNLTN